ncbi:MAG: aromatic ring-opening dioxygenase [Betaproteobacteria bacterium]|nr:aromatic ring-opening dioxygenase [Betaproteobacteria bacterium]
MRAARYLRVFRKSRGQLAASSAVPGKANVDTNVASAATAAYHAHIYYTLETRSEAIAFRNLLVQHTEAGAVPQLLYVGQMHDGKVGPHPIPQFEIHFTEDALANLLPLIEASGFTALVHPLTDDDVADHTTLARWIGSRLELDLTTLDPPGVNQGIARFAKTDF